MSLSPRSCFSLFLSTVLLLSGLLGAGPTHAQSADGALVELVPLGAIVADGSTPVGLALVALGPDGAPIAGLKAKVSVGA
ncbi:MAG: hypothetical protein ABIO70_23475, partial [Pseudomonadota bacterium]